jgi:hypothetical protein
MVAALATVGTLPGRTQGLGLITEPLLRDLNLSRGEVRERHNAGGGWIWGGKP